jgi:bacterioferritin-associated ferredoxin
MLICSCRAASERTVKTAIAAGARSVPEIALLCGAGSKCRGCWPALEALLRESTEHPADRERTGAHSAA